MQNTSTKEMTYKLANGDVMTFRFDMGTARTIKEITGVDPMKEGLPGDWWESAAAIFTAAYLRACKVYKTLPAYTVQDLKSMYEELDLNEAVGFVRAFRAAMSVQATPEMIAAVQEAEKLEDAKKHTPDEEKITLVEETDKVDNAPNI